MRHGLWIAAPVFFCAVATQARAAGDASAAVQALYVALADRYAAIVAYEAYREHMRHADFRIEQTRNWNLSHAFFPVRRSRHGFRDQSAGDGHVPRKPEFRWIGLMHRDGNALAVNDRIVERLSLTGERQGRKPDARLAEALKSLRRDTGKPTEIGMPHPQATHSVVLYRYLNDNGVSLGLKPGESANLLAIAVPPPDSPAFIRGKANRDEAAAFEQSLPWAEVVECGGLGRVAWYSKDVLPARHGHV